MLRAIGRPLRVLSEHLRLPHAAKAEYGRDRAGLPESDPGAEAVIEHGIAWLGRAQDQSTSHDGGVARHYSLITGWGSSYPETTGYIVPTMLLCAKLAADESVRMRAKRMLDWLVSIQFLEGAFQGGTMTVAPHLRRPTVFNTGQILLGLASGVREFGDEYRSAMCQAADWLVKVQHNDGCWGSHTTSQPGHAVAYDTHVAWGLIEAARLEMDKPYGQAALANVRWALGHQQPNGWFDLCCLTDQARPLTHTIGYVFRGLVEAFRFAEDKHLLQACRLLGDGLLTAVRPDGFLPGRLNTNWQGTVSSACLTGTAQIACCWLLLFKYTRDARYLEAGLAANRYVRRSVNVTTEDANIRGAVKGSFPIQGDYGRYQYLNWACKFAIEANVLEQELLGETNRVP